MTFNGKGVASLKPARKTGASFSIEATVTPGTVRRDQIVLEAEDPPARIELKRGGAVVAHLKTEDGWEVLEFGSRRIAKDETAAIRLSRDAGGKMVLEINDRYVGQKDTATPVRDAAEGKVFLGGDATGKANLFTGTIADLRVSGTAVTGSMLDAYRTRANALVGELSDILDFAGALEVHLDPPTVDGRFNEVKAILAAAGVQDVSALSRLTIDRPTTIARNQVLVAPPKVSMTVDWTDLATKLEAAGDIDAVNLTATTMANRNSKAMLAAWSASKTTSAANVKGGETGKVTRAETAASPALGARMKTVSGAAARTAGDGIAMRHALKPGSNLAARLDKPLMGDLIQPAKGVDILRPEVIGELEGPNPEMWPVFTPPLYVLTSIATIPVDTSVIIAGVLDLTNQELRIEPDVKKLYIIAEEIIGDPNASIKWRRPGGSTAPRHDDPDLNGRSWSGVHTGSGSRNGLPGGDGLDGAPGFAAADGVDAPDLEIWVKNLTAMPDIDLNGETGIKGGRGQRGGRGGNGAKGAGGEWWWWFGIKCWKHPGHGGDGGDGGRGGRGGPGGNGGDGGNISIGVLEGTLAASVEARAFRIKNQGGSAGRGGDGGPGGMGGNGGPHGNDWKDGKLVCGTGRDGATGAQGQPGPDGRDGHVGTDGTLRFFEFTQESWDEQLTRPWLYEMTPTHAFPGDTLTITGTRYADTDRVIIDGLSLAPTIEADESISVALPDTIEWGEKSLFVRRFDGDESNRLRFWVKPRLDVLPADLAPGLTVTLTGRAFANGAQVVYDGDLWPATFVSASELTFAVPGTGGTNAAEHAITLAVRNPDGEVSNTRSATVARTLDNGFRIGTHDFSFDNFAAGSPSWDTFEDTFGALEVWHEALDPIFGHPILTQAFYAFYHYFLLGEDNGGLATGFCTSLSAVALDEFYTGSTDTNTRYTLDGPTRERFTAIHGRLLSRESLLDFHDQGRRGNANVETSFRTIESSLRDGASRELALMLFFVPSGAAWDGGYFDKLGDSHCIVPIRMVYPVGHDGTSIEGVKLYCWDCNHPVGEGLEDALNCRLEFRLTDGEIRYDYYDGTGATPKFRSEDGITLATMSNGKYHLSDHDMPFSGPFGLTTFVADFLLSPADLMIEDGSGRRTGLQGGVILSEIPDSHPAYLAPNLYLLPADTALTRHVTGNASGSYSYGSLAPNGTFLSLENVATSAGETDRLAVNADASQIRFTPGASKTFTFNLAREVGGQVRAISISGGGAGPLAEMDMTVSPDLSVVRMGNRDTAHSVDVRVTVYEKASGANATLDRNGMSLATDHDLLVTVSDWSDLALTVRSLPFSL